MPEYGWVDFVHIRANGIGGLVKQDIAKIPCLQNLAIESDAVVFMHLSCGVQNNVAINAQLPSIDSPGGFSSGQGGAFTDKFIQAHGGLH
jgi:hypothetical protein